MAVTLYHRQQLDLVASLVALVEPLAADPALQLLQVITSTTTAFAQPQTRAMLCIMPMTHQTQTNRGWQKEA